ncbi:MAG: adenylyl-sulfate kinase [Elusimicrobiota bacterium]|nr:adenylyl-sulfate kinase [Endomicrobiia bacterium]MDW7998805.1 adenylyl-sulfate kinase [Thermodesulfovibrio sp.]MDW8165902.1 adenylyl-sulfate kinase [Elusimicrobiota bacterium]
MRESKTAEINPLKLVSNNVIWHKPEVTRRDRETLNGHKSLAIWFTGLPSSGKSTIAHAVEKTLHELEVRTYTLDGDNVRHGLCADLGFSPQDRKENLRRIAEMVKLFIDAGIVTLCAFVSPYEEDRERIKKHLGEENFVLIYCRCPVEVCEARDPKGMYTKAKRGEIKEYTGVSAPYEEPLKPNLILDTNLLSIKECVEKVLALVIPKLFSNE